MMVKERGDPVPRGQTLDLAPVRDLFRAAPDSAFQSLDRALSREK
jgi:hypothetical protein